METGPLDQTALDRIAEEFSEAIRRGEKPIVDAYVRQYGDSTDHLRQLLASIAMIEELKQQSSGPTSPKNCSKLAIDQLDDYTIVREIGRGGMGVVFEAIHQSLGRRVAVKVLASSMLGDSKHIARFRREARAAARLRHPNIVPVFGVGQSSEHHYYVMDFINGVTLRQCLSSVAGQNAIELPSSSNRLEETDRDLASAQTVVGNASAIPAAEGATISILPPPHSAEHFRWAAQLGVMICDGLQYAHSQGVLHRDIKPGNLLVDRQGIIWIADFGLAKLAEPQGMTMTGEVVGTPQYMAPESFEGTYDVASETYCVGLTLYEMLTLRPAFEGKSPGDVIRQASQGVSVTPRKWAPGLPRDLETIVMKSLSHDPQARYTSAGQLGDDLQRFLTDRPITARRSTFPERLVRWSRREPKLALLTFVTFTSLLALAVVAAIGYWQTRGALNAAQIATASARQMLDQRTAALATAQQQRNRAETNLQVALRAFNEVTQNISDRGISPDAGLLGEIDEVVSPNVTPADAKLLQALLGFFDELAANNSEDLRAESAIAGRRAGDIYQRLGRLRDAERAYTDALARYQALAENAPQETTHIIAQAEIKNELAVIVGLRGNPRRAHELFNETAALLSESGLESQDGRFQYARAHRLFASLGGRLGIDNVSRSTANSINRPTRPATMILKLRTDHELDAVDEAIDVLVSLIEQSPDEIRYRVELARAYRDRAKAAARIRLWQESETAIVKSIQLFETLLAENQDSDAIRYELATTLSSTSVFGFNQMLRLVRADELSAELQARSPTVPRYDALRAHTLEQLASQRQRSGNLDLAERNLSEAIKLYDALIDQSPELNLYRTRNAQALESLSEIQQRQGDAEAAEQTLELAIRILQDQNRPADLSPIARVQLQRLRQKLGRIQEKP